MKDKDEQIQEIIDTIINQRAPFIRAIMKGTLEQAYNRGFEAGCMKAQEQMMAGEQRMKGYKAFDKDFKCRGFQYEVGRTYEFDGEIILCKAGFHFCKNIVDCFKYYTGADTRFAEVDAEGFIIAADNDSKCVTNRITILSEISRDDAVKMSNTGNGNTGNRNTGNWNTGNWNTGNRNTGNWNTGNRNTGDGNTGNRNTGNWNTGDWNTGDGNTGDWNTNDFESGCFCTQGDGLRFFNKSSSMYREDWVNSRARYILGEMPDLIVEWISSDEMSEDEKIQNPSHETTGGYLKVTDKRDARQEWWGGLTDDNKQEVMSLPNFDADIFRECTGIDVMAQEQMMEESSNETDNTEL